MAEFYFCLISFQSWFKGSPTQQSFQLTLFLTRGKERKNEGWRLSEGSGIGGESYVMMGSSVALSSFLKVDGLVMGMSKHSVSGESTSEFAKLWFDLSVSP